MKLNNSVNSALWVIGTQGSTILLRLVSSIILTRLLFPEAFGQVMIVTSITSLISLISDVGFRGSIINNPRGAEDKDYVNTIWTLKIVRGIILALVILLLSELSHLVYPDVPELNFFLKIAALNTLVTGLISTKIFQSEKRMDMKRIGVIQIFSRVSALIATILFIQIEPSAAAILFGDVVASIIMVGLTHKCLGGTSNRIKIERSATSVIFRYGRWIFVATFMGWVINEGHRFVFGLTLSAETLGFYALASNIALMARGLLNTFSDKWVFPMYSKLGDHPEMEPKASKLRFMMLVLASFVIFTLGNISELLIDLIYEDRYANVAKMVTVICIGSMGLVIADCYIPIFKSRADSFSLMKSRIIQGLLLSAGLYLGYKLGEAEGLIIGTSVAWLIGGVSTAWFAQKHFTNKLFLLDSVFFALIFGFWLYIERNTLNWIFA